MIFSQNIRIPMDKDGIKEQIKKNLSFIPISLNNCEKAIIDIENGEAISVLKGDATDELLDYQGEHPTIRNNQFISFDFIGDNRYDNFDYDPRNGKMEFFEVGRPNSERLIAAGMVKYGGWLLKPNDRVLGIGDFDGNGKHDVLISSDWGIGILTIKNNRLTSICLYKYGNKLGGWLLRKNDALTGEGTQKIEYDNRSRIGDFNGDGRDDILISSDWGIGILTLNNQNKLTTLVLKPYSTKLGGWLLKNTDKFQGLADFNGDGRDDILISSDWGLGVITMPSNGTLTSILLKPNNTRFNGWLLDTKREDYYLVGDIDSDNKVEFIIKSDWGIALFKVENNTYSNIKMLKYGKGLSNVKIGESYSYGGIQLNGEKYSIVAYQLCLL